MKTRRCQDRPQGGSMTTRTRFKIFLASLLASFAMLAIAVAASAQEFPIKTHHPDRSLARRRPDRRRHARDGGGRGEASRPADHHREQGRRRRHGRPGDHGRDGQARRLHDRADADHGLSAADDAEHHLDGDDFTYIVHLTGYTFAAMAHADTPFKTWQDVLDYAKTNPGKITYAHQRRRLVAASRHGDDGGEVRASSSPMCRSRAQPR